MKYRIKEIKERFPPGFWGLECTLWSDITKTKAVQKSFPYETYTVGNRHWQTPRRGSYRPGGTPSRNSCFLTHFAMAPVGVNKTPIITLAKLKNHKYFLVDMNLGLGAWAPAHIDLARAPAEPRSVASGQLAYNQSALMIHALQKPAKSKTSHRSVWNLQPLSIASVVDHSGFNSKWMTEELDHLSKTVHEDTCHVPFKAFIWQCKTFLSRLYSTKSPRSQTSTMRRFTEVLLLVACTFPPSLFINGLLLLSPTVNYTPEPRNAVIRGLLVLRQGACPGSVECGTTGCCPVGWSCCSG